MASKTRIVAFVVMYVCALWMPLHAQQSRKLAFVIPEIYGPEGLTLDSETHRAHFDSSFRANFSPFNTAMASQLTSLPLPSTAAGFTYTYDSTLGIYNRSAQSFGPILAERAETIGKDKFYLGFSYQQFSFDTMDDIDLDQFPAVFTHSPTVDPNSPFLRDIITTQNVIDVQVGQFTTFFTFGVTDRLDVSVAAPILNAQLDVISDTTIRRIGTVADPTFPHTFRSGQDVSRHSFSSGSSASGLGDVVLRVKGTVTKWERAALALGADVRLPTGDELNFLGTGAAGFKPFLVLSYNYGRFSPHFNVGYQFNGNSVLAGNVQTGEKASLPEQFLYVAGVDIGISPRFSMAVDFLGQRLIDAQRAFAAPFTAVDGSVYPATRFEQGSFNTSDGAVGFKINPVGTLLVTFNLLMKLDSGGLRDRVTPLIGVSFTP
ncbi:MAG: transporter [Bryobacterales bacterium]